MTLANNKHTMITRKGFYAAGRVSHANVIPPAVYYFLTCLVTWKHGEHINLGKGNICKRKIFGHNCDLPNGAPFESALTNQNFMPGVPYSNFGLHPTHRALTNKAAAIKRER
jgi:hypothetical protein